MKYYKNNDGKVFAFEADGSQDEYIGENLILMTDDEVAIHLNPLSGTYIPTEVTMRQARLALYDANLLQLVDESLALMPIEEQRIKAQIEWEYSTSVQRNSSLIYGLAGALGLTDDMLDDLFLKASTL